MSAQSDSLQTGASPHQPDRGGILLPALHGTGRALDDRELYLFPIEELKRYCETFEITAEGTWSFSADMCTPDRIRLFDGEIRDFLKTNFGALMDLRFFHEGRFWLDVPLSSSTLDGARFEPEVVGMCSVLGIDIDVHFETNSLEPSDP